MYCKSCNSPILEGASFCTNCGKRVNEENLNPEVQQGFAMETPVVEPVITPVEPQGFATEAPVVEPVITSAEPQVFATEAPVVEPVITSVEPQGFATEAPVVEPVVTSVEPQGFAAEAPVVEPVVTSVEPQGFAAETPVVEPVVTSVEPQGFPTETPVVEPVITPVEPQGFATEAPVVEPVITETVGGQETLTIEPVVEEKANILLAVLSWFIPLVGIILFFVKKKDEPKTAKACGLSALISIIISFIFVIVVIMIGIYNTNKIINKTKDAVNNINITMPSTTTRYNYTNQSTTKKNSNSNTDTTGVTNDWKKYTFKVNGKVMTLPVDYSELQSATGFNIKSAQEKSYLQGGYYAMLNMYKDDFLALYIDVINRDTTDKLYTDCKVSRVWQSKYQVERGADALVFPGGLTVGMEITEEQVKTLLGEPTKVSDYSSGNYVSKTLKYNADTTYTTTNYYEIEIINGKIDSLKLDKRR